MMIPRPCHFFLAVIVALAPATCGGETTQFQKILHTAQLFTDNLLGKQTFQFKSNELYGLQVIGAGFPRTGTKSMQLALKKLGYSVYDYRSINENGHGERWVKAAQEWKYNNDTSHLSELLDEIEALGYTVTLDFPVFMLSAPMAQVRPNAKVLLSVRDSPKAWAKSYMTMTDITLRLFYCRPFQWFFPDLHAIAPPIVEASLDIKMNLPLKYPQNKTRPLPWFELVKPVNEYEMNMWMDAYLKHNQYFIDNISQDRLLVYNVKQGWGPWVDFFAIDDQELLSEDFPFVNESKTLVLLDNIIWVFGVGFPIWALIVIGSTLRILTDIFGPAPPKKVKKLD